MLSPSLTSQQAAQLTDEALFLALQAGQAQALKCIYDRHIRLIRGVAFKIIKNFEDAEEIAQEVFLALQRQTYDVQRGSLKGFLVMMTRSRSIDRLRSQKSRLQHQKNWQILTPIQSITAPMEYAELQERSAVVREAIPHLSVAQQQTLEYFYYQGLSQSEIAKQTNKPLGTVKTHARKGLINLRMILQEAGTL